MREYDCSASFPATHILVILSQTDEAGKLDTAAAQATIKHNKVRPGIARE